jgi:hypothetical protein
VLGGRVTAVGSVAVTGAGVTPGGTGGMEVEIPPDGASETKSLGRSLGISEPIYYGSEQFCKYKEENIMT